MKIAGSVSDLKQGMKQCTLNAGLGHILRFNLSCKFSKCAIFPGTGTDPPCKILVHIQILLKRIWCFQEKTISVKRIQVTFFKYNPSSIAFLKIEKEGDGIRS